MLLGGWLGWNGQSTLTGAINVASKLSLFFAELKRRKVYRVAVVYVVVGAGIIGLADAALPSHVWERLQIPIVVLVLVGLPIALVLAWAYEVKPEGAREAESTPEAVIEAPQSEQRKSIVVLPFDNMSPDPGDAYFSDGLTEEIITNLSYVSSLRVISRTSAMVLKGTQKDVGTIGKELDVQYVLEGSVRKAGNDLRITAQLIDAGRDEHLWAEKYDGVLEDVFLMQETVSHSIVEALQLELNPKEHKRFHERPIENLQEYECYLRARHELGRFTKESLEQGIRTLQHGLELFPDSSILTATLGEAYCTYIDVAPLTDQSYLDRAEELATRTLFLDPHSAHGKKLLGLVARARGNLIQACRHMKAAYDADPNDAGIMLYTGWFISNYVARFDITGPIFERLLEIDPLNPINYQIASGHHVMTGDLATALTLARKAYEMTPEMPQSRLFVGLILGLSGRIAEAIQEVEAVVEAGPHEALGGIPLFFKHALAGEAEEALDALDERTRTIALGDPDFPYWLAGPLAMIGRTDMAMDWLQHALDRGFINYPFLSELGPFMENLRGEERFQEMVENVKQKWETFEF